MWSAFPIYWALNTSFTTLNGAQSVPAHFVPSPFTAHNYRTLLNPSAGGVGNQFWRSFLNSTIESGLATVLTVVIALFAAYAFARLEFRGKRIILVVVLATLLLPVYATLIPLYRIMSNVHLVNTYLGIILVYTSGFLPLAIWIMYNYFASVPRELEEAAFVDGATPVVALWRVMIPVSLPGIAATAIIVFLMGWAQFIFPLVLSQRPGHPAGHRHRGRAQRAAHRAVHPAERDRRAGGRAARHHRSRPEPLHRAGRHGGQHQMRVKGT